MKFITFGKENKNYFRGDTRERKGFLFLPRREESVVNGKPTKLWRWLERAEWTEVYSPSEVFPMNWSTKKFTDEN